MSNLHQIIYPAAVADYRIFQCAAVNTGVGTNLNIVTDNHPADLRNPDMATVFKIETKPVAAYPRAAINITIITHLRICQ